MYRGVVRVFQQESSSPKSNAESPWIEQPSPVERELGRAIAELRSADEEAGKSCIVGTQTVGEGWFDSDYPAGYEVPSVFIRSMAEAAEVAITTYCPSLVDDRERGVLRLLQQVADFVCTPRHLFFDNFEPTPTWYDYAQISVFDCITATQMGAAQLMPPTTRVVIPNVNVPLYESLSAKHFQESIPHMPQVEVTLYKFSIDKETSPIVVAQSVIVPLELFTKSQTLVCHLQSGEEREISYKALFVKNQSLN